MRREYRLTWWLTWWEEKKKRKKERENERKKERQKGRRDERRRQERERSERATPPDEGGNAFKGGRVNPFNSENWSESNSIRLLPSLSLSLSLSISLSFSSSSFPPSFYSTENEFCVGRKGLRMKDRYILFEKGHKMYTWIKWMEEKGEWRVHLRYR